MDDKDPEQATQDELRDEAGQLGEDPATSREALENALMDEDESVAGEDIGEPTP